MDETGAHETGAMKQLGVLVVDDDLEVCEYLQSFLSGEGYAVNTLCDPAKVIQE